jgi:hypothetical protein
MASTSYLYELEDVPLKNYNFPRPKDDVEVWLPIMINVLCLIHYATCQQGWLHEILLVECTCGVSKGVEDGRRPPALWARHP